MHSCACSERWHGYVVISTKFHHWMHWKLSFWQLLVWPLMKISSKWQHFLFSGSEECQKTAQNLSWWRHQMETFSTLMALCAGNSPVTGEFPAQRPVTRSFDVSFDLRLNKRLSKQSWGWWFETPLRSLWRHCNGLRISKHMYNHTYTLTHAYSETVCRYFFAKFLSVADVVDVWYKWFERDHSKCTGWVVLNFGKHAGCDSAPIWLTFQGHASKVKVAANAALGLANHWHWVIILLPRCQWNGTKRYG